MTDAEQLKRIRLLHTIIWAIFVAAIFAIVPAAATGHFNLAAGFSLLVWGEVAVLVANGWRCPLTGIAERHGSNQAANFDIYLPEWLARWNKLIFGCLFVAAEIYLLWLWMR